MRTFFLILLLIALAGCASTSTYDSTDPKVSYGGSFRTRVISSKGVLNP
jgi:uncharacterized protein YceK